MPKQAQQKPAVVFNKVLQQLRQQQQGTADVGTNPAPAASLAVSVLHASGAVQLWLNQAILCGATFAIIYLVKTVKQ